MTGAQIFALPDRGVIAVNGPDASTWLDNLVTNDLTLFYLIASRSSSQVLTSAPMTGEN